MKVLVTGAAGLLGGAVLQTLARRGHAAVGLSRSDLDVTRSPEVERALASHVPDVVVHAAAFTGVDAAESDRAAAFAVNEGGARNVARACRAAGVHLLAVSTDFVFGGAHDRPWRPDDAPAPSSVYGASKWAGERAIGEELPTAAIVRTSWLFGPHGRDFVDAILRRARGGEALRVVSDQTGCPTWTPTLAGVLTELAERRVQGIWHVCDRGPTTWFAFARAICAEAGVEPDITPVTTAEWDAPAPRPLYSVLDCSATERLLGRTLPEWRDTLARHLAGEDPE